MCWSNGHIQFAPICKYVKHSKAHAYEHRPFRPSEQNHEQLIALSSLKIAHLSPREANAVCCGSFLHRRNDVAKGCPAPKARTGTTCYAISFCYNHIL